MSAQTEKSQRMLEKYERQEDNSIRNIGNHQNFHFDDRMYSSTMAFKGSYKYLLKRAAKINAHLLIRFNTESFSETDVTGKSAKEPVTTQIPFKYFLYILRN